MRAFSTIIAIFFLMVFLGIVTAGMSFLSISGLQSQYYTAQTINTQQYSESCVGEVMRRLRDDLNYSGGTVPLYGTVQCVASVTGNASSKTIVATVTIGEFVTSNTVDIEVVTVGQANNFRITGWREG